MPASKREQPRFKTVQTLKVDYAPVKITQYESTRTGMRIAVVDKPGPKVEGEFALATEINDNSGSPHTLEHLVFMGSKNYQYTGLLDKLSSRAFSTTNAGTATDYTSYSLKTAGWEGFAQILPVYLDHLVVPTLTDAACYTEVHHVDATGHDAGVVYAEMQGRENTPEDLMELHRRILLYPEGNGFRSETGGMTKELRVLTADRIRDYHKEMYQPKNLRVIVTGDIDHDELLQILDDFETSIVGDVPALDAPFRRPWVDSKPTTPLAETKVDTIQFPEEDESMGEVTVGYVGPSCDDALGNAAVSVLMAYLCGGPISVLENTLVEREQLCSAIYYQLETRPDMVIWFDMTAVETAKLRQVYERMVAVLKEVLDKPLDMSYMNDCLKRERRQIKERAEMTEDFFTQSIVEDHCFSNRDGRSLKDLESLSELDTLESWYESQWKEVISKVFVDNHHVCVLGEPSKDLVKKQADEEKARVKAQQERLGEEGLKKLSEKLEQAKAENHKEIPDSLFEAFPVPSPTSVKFLTTTTARAGSAKKMGTLSNPIQAIVDKADKSSSPLFVHFEHIPSNFVSIKLYLGTASLPTELRPVLSLYLANLFTTPIRDSKTGARIEFEEVVSDLEKESTSYWIDSSYGNQQMLSLQVVTEPDTYESIIAKIQSVLFDAIHDPIRLHASLTKLLADIPSEKRDGSSMVYAVNSMIQSTRKSNRRATNTLTKGVYLKRLRKLLKKDDGEATVIEMLEKVIKNLHRPENLRIYVAADVEKLRNPVDAWKALFPAGTDLSKGLEPLDDLKSTVSEAGKNPGSSAVVVPIPASDSSFACFTAHGPDSYDHPDVPALMVANAYLRAVEGPLWVAIRGTGLAYGTSLRRSTDLGTLHFTVDRSPDCYKAFVAGREEIFGHAYGSKPLQKLAIESAVGEIVFEMADEGATMSAAADESFVAQVLHGVSKDYSQQMLKKIGMVGAAEVQAAIQKWLVPLFKAESSNLVITCSKDMAEKMVERFGAEGWKMENKGLDAFEDDYDLQEVEGESEDDGDEDGEDDEEDGEDEDEDEEDE